MPSGRSIQCPHHARLPRPHSPHRCGLPLCSRWLECSPVGSKAWGRSSRQRTVPRTSCQSNCKRLPATYGRTDSARLAPLFIFRLGLFRFAGCLDFKTGRPSIEVNMGDEIFCFDPASLLCHRVVVPMRCLAEAERDCEGA